MAIDKRKIPKSDKAKRSLYMSPTYMKNLKGRDKGIEWEGEKTKSGSGDDYTFARTKKGATRGTSKHAIRTPYGDDVEKTEDKHMTFKKKGGGTDTYRRHKKVKGKSKLNWTGQFDKDFDIRDTGNYVETQDKKGKVTSQIQIKDSPEKKKKKTVKQKTTTHQGKKGNTIKPEVKESTAEYWKKSKKGPGYVPEKKMAEKENNDRIQKQIKSGFGDWASSDDFKKKMKSGSDAFKKKMKSGSDSFKKKMKSGSDAFKAKMKADSDAFKKKMRG